MVLPGFYQPSKGYFLTIVHLFIVVLVSAFLFTSCYVAKPTYLFKDIAKDTVINTKADTMVELKIQKNDILSLTISSLNPMEDQFFNSAIGTKSANAEIGAGGYVVGLEGNIYMHKLGSVMVAGMTRKELKMKLEKDLLPYLKDPIVTVNFTNHFITVMGDVGKTQLLNMPEEKISLIDVIALSSNVSEKGEYKNLLVIRETPTSKEFKHLNLEDHSIFNSPFYYLQPKDIVVINPYVEKNYQEQRQNRNSQALTTFLTALSIVVIILGLFRL